jgi:hypothetical protein
MLFGKAIVCALPLLLCACNPAASPSYSWEKIPASQLMIDSGLRLGVSAKALQPAQISIACSRSRQLHIVMRSKLSHDVADHLPGRDTLQLNIMRVKSPYDLPLTIAVGSIKDGFLTSTVSDPLDAKTLSRILADLPATPPGSLVAFGLRESVFQFDLDSGRGDLQKFANSCRDGIALK